MALPELANRFPVADKKEIEPGVRAAHGVPLIDLLEGENKKSPIAQDPVSIYSIDRPNGTECAVVFPALSGWELNRRLCGISKMQAEIRGVHDDFSEITRSMQGRLAKAHEAGLGVLWEVFSRSLAIHTKVFYDSTLQTEMTEERRQSLGTGYKKKVEFFEALSQLTPKPYAPIMDKERDMIDMLEGKSPVQAEELVEFFNLTEREIAAERSGSERKKLSNKIRKIIRYVQGESSGISQDQWDNLVVRAAKKIVLKDEKDPDKNNRYLAGVLHGFARQKVQLPENTVGISRGLEYFTIPKVKGLQTIGRIENDVYPMYFFEQDAMEPRKVTSFEAKVFVDESGNINFAGETQDDVRRYLERISKGAIPVNLAVPIVRFIETTGGERGFIFDEIGPDLSQEVVEDIEKRVNASERSSKPFAKDWLSGMVGVDMLVIAHPDIRGKKKDEADNWSSIWGKDRITMSEVMDQEIKQGERTQINGPVQVGIIALHASARYPETFDPFMDNVVSLVKRNENPGNI